VAGLFQRTFARGGDDCLRRIGQPLRAVRLLGAAESVQERIGTSTIGVVRLQDEYQSAVAWMHTKFDETVYQAAWSEGCAMSMDQAIPYALEE